MWLLPPPPREPHMWPGLTYGHGTLQWIHGFSRIRPQTWSITTSWQLTQRCSSCLLGQTGAMPRLQQPVSYLAESPCSPTPGQFSCTKASAVLLHPNPGANYFLNYIVKNNLQECHQHLQSLCFFHFFFLLPLKPERYFFLALIMSE